MEQFKKAKVIMLPTNNKSLLHINYSKLQLNKFEQLDVNNQNLYIISNDEIKKGDWCLHKDGKGILCKVNLIFEDKDLLLNNATKINPLEFKKIIATTDTSLATNSIFEIDNFDSSMFGGKSEIIKLPSLFNLPQPSQQFITKYIEEYNKGEVITDVLVEYEDFNWDLLVSGKTIINQILKINPKDNTITIKELKNSRYYQELNFKLKHIVLF
jgi:hypothetical protein